MDDEQIDDIPTMNCNCGKLTMVGDPVTWKKSGRMFGFWGQFQHMLHIESLICRHYVISYNLYAIRTIKCGSESDFYCVSPGKYR